MHFHSESQLMQPDSFCNIIYNNFDDPIKLFLDLYLIKFFNISVKSIVFPKVFIKNIKTKIS